MARKNKNLASFGDVARIENTEENNMNKDINNNNNDFLDNLIEGTKKKQEQNVLTGVYLNPSIVKVLDHLARKGGRGAKSKIVNEALEKIFKEKGLI